jgi:hypothetical protein
MKEHKKKCKSLRIGSGAGKLSVIRESRKAIVDKIRANCPGISRTPG